MLNAKNTLLILLGVVAAWFAAMWLTQLSRRRNLLLAAGDDPDSAVPPSVVPAPPTTMATGAGGSKIVNGWYYAFVGFVTDFMDTLGIGSFATTTTLFRLRNAVDDEKIPGTLNVGHALPTIAQAFIYITIVEIEIETLWLLIAASVLGSWLGAGVVTRLPRRGIQIGMGVALIAAAGLILGRLLKLFPEGGDALGLDGSRLAIAFAGNFLFGALMTIGVGAYAPIMVMVSLLGMNPKSAFPLMMGSCAFLMPIASARFVRAGKYDAPAALGLTLFGIPAVLLAAFIVKELPLDVVRWLVIVVVLYTATSMLWAARPGVRSEE